MKIILIQTNYPSFLDEFHKKNNLKNKTYSELKKIWSRELFGSSNFYLKSLKPLGWSGDEIIANDSVIQSAWAKEHNIKTSGINSNLISFLPQRIKNLIPINSAEKHIVFEQIKFHRPDVVYIHDVTYFTKKELDSIKKYSKLVVGQIAYPKPLNQQIFYSYDLIISSLPNYVKDFKKMGIKTEYLKWCFEPTVLDFFKKKDKMYDVTYIGGLSPLHSKGNKTLDEVSKYINVNIWGYGRANVKPAWGKEMYDIFNKSKIIINRHINISGPYANNMRLYEATGMGALLLTDAKKNMHEFFDVGKEVVTYKDPSDLVKKIKYYLKNDKERITISKAGQARTLKDHTYKIRMKELDLILKKYL